MALNEYTVRMAESYEKAAVQAEERSDKTKASECWAKAGDGFLEAGRLATAIDCFEKAGVLEHRAVALADSSAAADVLEQLDARNLDLAACLARLHLLSVGRAIGARSAHAACLEAAAKTQNPTGRSTFLTGAMLSAAWTDDMIALAEAADAAIAIRPRRWDSAILAKVAATLDFDLLADLENTFEAKREGLRPTYGPDRFRLLAPIHAWRGIRLVPLVDAMSSHPATKTIANDYRRLITGLESGDADAALTHFVAAAKSRASRPDPSRPIQSWEAVDDAFAVCFPVQPEAITAAILWDQVWAVRAGVRQVGEAISAVRSASKSLDWSTVLATVDSLLDNPILPYLSQVQQVEIYKLGCAAAFHAEHWDRFDVWADILERRFGAKGILQELVITSETSRQGDRA